METDQTVDLATGDGAECGVADRDVEGRVPGIGIGDEFVSAHNQEDKEPTVTVSGSGCGLGIRVQKRGTSKAGGLVNKQ